MIKTNKMNENCEEDETVLAPLFISASPVCRPLYNRPFLLIMPSSLNSPFSDKLLSCKWKIKIFYFVDENFSLPIDFVPNVSEKKYCRFKNARNVKCLKKITNRHYRICCFS